MEWITPANLCVYNVINAFRDLKTVDWSQTKNFKNLFVNDIVYIYISKHKKNIGYVKFKCKVLAVNKTKITHNDLKYYVNPDLFNQNGMFAELEVVAEFPDGEEPTLIELQKHGLNGHPQGSRKISSELSKYLDEYVSIYNKEDPYSSVVYGTSTEGAVKYYYTHKYERNPKLRRDAIKIHGYKCEVCGFDFQKVYGKYGACFIEVHHIKPLHTLNEEMNVDPEKDLVCLCANCHRMIHRKADKIIFPDELKKHINNKYLDFFY